MDYATHKKAFLLRLQGKSYQQIGRLMHCSPYDAKRFVTLSRIGDRCAIKAELSK